MISKSRPARFAAVLAAAVTSAAVVTPQASADTGTVNQTGFAVAYVSGGMLEVWGCSWPSAGGNGFGCGPILNGPAVAPGTSPSITKVGARGYEVAYQGANHDLWIAGTLGGGDRGFHMMPTSSPSITSPPSTGGYDIAFQDNIGQLWVVGSDSRWDNVYSLSMDHASSPSIAGFGTSFQVAYVTGADTLGIDGADGGLVEPTVKITPGTSPSLARDPVTGEYDIAFHADAGPLTVLDFSAGSNKVTSGDGGFGMASGTSPSLSNTPATAGNPLGGMESGINAFDGRLFGSGAQLSGPVINPRNPNGIQLAPGSSPAAIGITLPAYLGAGTTPGYEMFYTDLSNKLHYVIGSAFSSTYLSPDAIGAIDPGTSPSAISFQ